MLSYRHSFHAGNFADVLKHLVLVELIHYLQKKNAGFDYIATHAGAGLYQLHSSHGEKLQEYRDGIGRLTKLEWPELTDYLQLVAGFNKPDRLSIYPGSPLIALTLLRPQDRAWLYDLHPTDYDQLRRNTAKFAKVKVFQEDGFKSLLSLMPPTSRRSLVLIDPSYEVKSDYGAVIRVIQLAHQKFSTGTYALWYPVVDRHQIDRLERAIKATGIRHIQRFELGVVADGAAPGMTSSGMIVVNPTWGLFDRMAALLPRLAKKMGRDGAGVYRCDVLAAE